MDNRKKVVKIKVSKGFRDSLHTKTIKSLAQKDITIKFNKGQQNALNKVIKDQQLKKKKHLSYDQSIPTKKDRLKEEKKEEKKERRAERKIDKQPNRKIIMGDASYSKAVGSIAMDQLEGGNEIKDTIYAISSTVDIGKETVRILKPAIAKKVKDKKYVKKIADNNNKSRSDYKKLHRNYSHYNTSKGATVDKEYIPKNKKEQSSIESKRSSAETKKRIMNYALNKMSNNGQNNDNIFSVTKDLVFQKMKFMVAATLKKVAFFMLSAIAQVVIAILPIILIITILTASPFALLLPNPAKEDEVSVQELLKEEEDAFVQLIESEMINSSDSTSKVETEVMYMSLEGDTMVTNYYDVLATYGVKYNMGDMALIMEDEYAHNFKNLYKNMNYYEVIESIEEEILENDEVFTTTYRTVYVYQKTYTDLIAEGFFDNEETKIIKELMQPENLLAMKEANGLILVSGLTEEEKIEINRTLVPGEKGSEAVKLAMEKIGSVYSQSYRYGDGFYDCSSLTSRIYKELGVDLFYHGTDVASYQARKMVELNRVIAYSELAPGDLIFWANNRNDRYLSITHVGIYAGNGKTIEASYSRGQVVYRPIWGIDEIVLCARPYD